MGKLVLQMMISLDGYVAGPNDAMDWLDSDPTMGVAHIKLAKEAEAVLVGHNVYMGLAGYWPSVIEKGAVDGAPSNELELAQTLTDTKKIVLATKDVDTSWSNSQECHVTDEADLVEKVKALKADMADSNAYILVYGGAQTARTLIKHGLIDDLKLDICPVALGGGTPLFDERVNLKLVETVPYESGAVLMHYQPKAEA